MHYLLASGVDWHVVWVRIGHPNHPFFLALTRTVYIAVIAQIMGVILGLFAALMRMSKLRIFRILSGIYVWIFRGTPLLVQIFFIYYASNQLLGFTLIPNSLNVGLFSLDGAIFAGILALGVNEGAYMREIVRAGIDSIDKGQMEAATSLGMRRGLAMRRIVLPQAARVIIPPLGNEFNNMLKNTSLLFAIGVYEMFADAEIGYSNSFQPTEYFLGVAFWYLVLTTVWTFIQAAIERKLAASERGEELSFRERWQEAWNPVSTRMFSGGQAR
jgi:polar amino acid transport system permease protein